MSAARAAAEPLPLLISPVVDERFGATAVLGIPEQDRTDELIAQRLGIPCAERRARSRGPDWDPAQTPARARAVPSLPQRALGAGAECRRSPAVRYQGAGDFSISRQRSWGTPIPIVYCEGCGTVPVPKEQLPVVLPLDLKPTGAGNPLAEREDFVNTTCPRCGGPAQARDGHAGLPLRRAVAVDPRVRARPRSASARWRRSSRSRTCARGCPPSAWWRARDSGNFVFDQRIVTKALRDIGPLAFLADGEPFAGCLFHEMVIRDGRKMSKHLGNVVDPDELVERFGADTVRMAVLWAARPQKSLNWSDSAVQYCQRFLHSLWQYSQARFAQQVEDSGELDPRPHRAPAQAP